MQHLIRSIILRKVFALGLMVNSFDVFDMKYVITTSENPDLSAKCVVKHLNLSDSDIPVGVGTPFPEYALRGGICAIPDRSEERRVGKECRP